MKVLKDYKKEDSIIKALKSFAILVAVILSVLIFPKTAFSQYDDYIWNPSSVAPITAENASVRDELVKEVKKIISAGHLAPALFDTGLRTGGGGDRGLLFWDTPAEILTSLSMAYPYLPPNLQTQVKTYLAGEIATYPPHQYGLFPPTWGGHKLSEQPGTRREWFPFNLNRSFNIFPPINPSIESLYPIWLYSYTIGDWSYATNNWNSFKTIYTNFKNQGAISSYLQIAGIIGYARLAKQLNQTAEANDAAALASAAFSNSDFEQFLTAAQDKFLYDGTNKIFTTPIFLYGQANQGGIMAGFFPREIGRFLADNVLTQIQNYSSQIEKDAPLWYITMAGWAGSQKYGYINEDAYLTPEVGWTNFMLHAYILKDDIETLKGYLDFPSRLGDLFHIQKLVAVIEAKPAAIPADLNQDTKVNSQDIAILLSSWGRTDKPEKDINQDQKIDTQDLIQILSSWTNPITQNIIHSPLSFLSNVLNKFR